MEALFGAAYLDSSGDLAAIERIVLHIGLLPQLSLSPSTGPFWSDSQRSSEAIAEKITKEFGGD